jgi:hypothetical protein
LPIGIDIPGKPIGEQDHYIAGFGGIACFTLCRDGAVKAAPLAIDGDTRLALQDNLLLFPYRALPIDPTRRHYDELAAIAGRRDQEAVDRMIDILVHVRASGGRLFPPRARSWSTKPRRRYSIPTSRARIANPEHQAIAAPRAVASFSIEKVPRGSPVRYLDCLCNAKLLIPH